MGQFLSKSSSYNNRRRQGTEYSKQKEEEEIQGFKAVKGKGTEGKFSDTKSYRNLKLIREIPDLSNDKDKKVRFLNYDYQKLEKLPEELLKETNLLQLYMLNNRITDWAPLGNLTFLTTIDLSFNPIKSFPPEFLQLKKLENLSLSGCRLSELSIGLVELKELQRIKLSLNNLTIFPVYLLRLPKLTELNLTGNLIDCWFSDERNIPLCPSSSFENTSQQLYLEDKRDDERFIVNCHNLITLLLSRNQLPYFPNSLCLSEVRTLKLAENRLRRLPKDIKNMKSLQTFSANHNRIEKIGRSFHGLKSLKILDLSHNRIKHISPKLFEDPHYALPTLFEVFLDNNQITELHKKFFFAWNLLAVVDFSKNQLKTLPEISSAENIANLFLGHNQLIELPACFSTLTRIEILNISENQLKFLPNFSEFKKMRVLEASYNPFEVSKITTQNLPLSLEELNLSGCSLESLPWLELPNLKYLNVAHNLIKELPNRTLACPSLIYLDVQCNHFLELPPLIQEQCSKNVQIELGQPETNLIRTYSNQYSIGVSEMIGKRPKMEDAVIINPKFNGAGVLIGLFDGHGGTEASEFCAEKLEHYYFETWKSFQSDTPEIIKKIITKVFPKLEHAFSMHIQKELKKPLEETRVGTTSIIVHIVGNTIYIANCGDSRAVLGLRDGKALRVTKDHKPLDRDEIERISNLGGFVSETGRVNGQLAVSRSIGDFYLSPAVTCEPFVHTYNIDNDFSFLVAACDGLWDVMTDEEVVDLTHGMFKCGQNTQYIASALRDKAYLRGSSDNISVIILTLKP